LIGAIVGEFVAAQAGVGFFIKQQSDYFNTAAVFAGLIVLMLISLALLVGLKFIEKWALGWQDAKGVIQSNDAATT
jgi:NitT/TauT family transport system permease protein